MMIEVLNLGASECLRISKNTVHSYHIHSHTYYEMTLYEPFDGKITVNDKSFKINSRSCTLIAPSDYHAISVNDDMGAKFIKICFSADALPKDFVAAPSCVVQNVEDNGLIISIFKEILKIRDDLKFVGNLINTAVNFLERYAVVFEKKLNPSFSLVTRAIEIINERFGEDITETKVAQALGVTPQYLSHLFSEVARISFNKYLVSVRLRHSRMLLLSTSLPITDICYDCGYGSLSHFIRSFKRECGVSPSEYRRENSGKHQKSL